MATLHVYLPGSGVVTHELSGTAPVSIGWAPENVISITDPSVSRRHAEIVCEGETYRLRDLGSANKCWLNGVAVAAAPIHDGDSIRFGTVETIFRLQASTASKMAAEATPHARLILDVPGEKGETVFRCEAPLVSIGWKSYNAVRIQDPSISGHHAQILLVRGKYRLKDLNSTNKTLINGHAIIEAEINDGDRVQFGAVSGVFKVEYRIAALPTAEEADPAAKALASQVEEQQAKIDALLKEKESLVFHNKQLSTQLEEAAAKAEKNTASEREKAEALKRELEAKIDAETARACASEQALKSVRDTGEQTTRQLREAQALIETLSGDQTGNQQKITDLSHARDAVRQESERLAGELNQANINLEIRTKERDAECQKGVELSQKLADAEGNILALKGRISEADEKLAGVANEVKTAAASALEWEAKCEHERQRAATLEAAQGEAQSQIAALTAERDALKTASTEAAEVESKITALIQEREALQSSSAEAQGRIDALTKEREALQASSSEAQGRIDALTKERDALQASSSEAQGRIDALTKEREALQSSSSEAQGRIEMLTQDCEALQTSVNEAQKQIAALTLERDTLLAASTKLAMEPPRPSEALAAKLAAPSAPSTALPKPPTLSLLREDAPAAPATTPAPTVSSEVDPKSSLMRIAKPILPSVPPPAAQPRSKNSTTLKFDVDGALLKVILEQAPEALNGMRRCLHAFIKNQSETRLLEELLTDLHELTQQTSKANLTAVCTLSLALETLIDDLLKIPGQINPSSLRTVSQSIDFLVTLLDEKNLFRTREPYSANIIAVDDDADARKTIRGAIEAVNLRAICAEDSKTTLAVLIEKKFDLIFIDVGLPDMNGFELCTRLRKLPDYKKTPVVFITGAVTVQNRVQSSLSGGNDFIAKPFNLLELGVKALIWIFKSQLGLV